MLIVDFAGVGKVGLPVLSVLDAYVKAAEVISDLAPAHDIEAGKCKRRSLYKALLGQGWQPIADDLYKVLQAPAVDILIMFEIATCTIKAGTYSEVWYYDLIDTRDDTCLKNYIDKTSWAWISNCLLRAFLEGRT